MFFEKYFKIKALEKEIVKQKHKIEKEQLRCDEIYLILRDAQLKNTILEKENLELKKYKKQVRKQTEADLAFTCLKTLKKLLFEGSTNKDKTEIEYLNMALQRQAQQLEIMQGLGNIQRNPLKMFWE